MTFLLTLVRQAGFVMLAGYVAVAAMIWFMAPSFGVTAPKSRLILMAIIGVFMLILYLVQKLMSAQRGSRRLESSMVGAGGTAVAVRPDKKAEIEQLKQRMNEAIAALKTSKLAKGRKGATALYALPWYIIIGSPGSGKSTALAKSDLNFPYLDPTGKGIRGVGGTRNCDWWFTSEAILLDTAGRYTTESEDREEWFAFLDQLKKYRPRTPINGIIVAVAVSEIMKASEDELTTHARTIRTRIDELINRLGITFPVYLLFTKCDLLDGFVETFEDLRKAERAQVWGATLNIDGDDRPPRVFFEKEFERLAKSLEERSWARLAAEPKADVRRKVYLFPLEFRTAQEPLTDFVGMVFQPNPYQEQPLFRGFYFSSGTQEGTPLELVMSKMMETFRLPVPLATATEEQGEKKSYFIHDLFEQIIFADQTLAGPSAKGARKLSRLRLWLSLGVGALCALWLAGAAVSYFTNSARIAAAKRVLEPVAVMNPSRGTSLDHLRSLDSLRGMLETLETGRRPIMQRWGLYQGDEIAERGREVYFAGFSKLFIQQAGRDLAEKLKDPAAHGVTGAQEYYALTRSYLILTRPEKADSAVLAQEFNRLLGTENADIYDTEPQELVARQVNYYRKHLTFAQKYPSDPAALQAARNYLSTNLTPEDYYNARVAVYGAGLRSIGLRDLEVASILSSSYKVPGAYTEAGWAVMKPVMGFEGPSKMSDWVLENLYEETPADLERMKRRMQDRLRATYAQKMGDAWTGMFNSLVLQVGSSPITAAGSLNDYVSDRGVRRVLAAANAATQMKGLDSLQARSVRERFVALRELMGRPKTEKDEGSEGRWPDYKDRIKDLSDAVNALAECQEGVSKEYTAKLRAAEQEVGRMLGDFDSDAQAVVRGLLKEPIQQVSGLRCGGGGAGGGGGGGAKIPGAPDFKASARYPFSPASAEDAALNDVAAYFHPQSGLFWQHYQNNWSKIITPDGDVIDNPDMEPSTPGQRNLVRRARAITDALFPAASPGLKVDYEIRLEAVNGKKDHLSKLVFAAGAKTMTYQFGPQLAEKWSWPTEGASKASLMVYDKNGRTEFESSFDSPWALFHLLDSATQRNENGLDTKFTWDFESPAGSGNRVQVVFRIRASTSQHPFARGFFGGF